jgi:hypothetical protein
MSWSPKCPDKLGFYWFYGYLEVGRTQLKREEEPKLLLVEVVSVSNGAVLTFGGRFLVYDSGVVGMFQPATLPDLPSIEEIKHAHGIAG